MEQQGQFSVLNFRLHARDLLFEMSVGREDVRQTIEILIEKEEPKGKAEKRCAAD
jgi:hypothetical protein